MIKKKVITFTSMKGLLVRFVRLFYGPTYFMTFKKINPALREKLLLTVSMSNECGG